MPSDAASAPTSSTSDRQHKMLDEDSATIASTQKNKNRCPYTDTLDNKAIISKNTTRSSSSRAATTKTY